MATYDYLSDPDAVTKDSNATWRYGKAPNYSKTREVWAQTKTQNHKPGSIEEMVENLVKNWEIEASFKEKLSDWRTVDPEKYTFAINGGPPQTAEHMLKVGTYNAIVAANAYYDPDHLDFEQSHRTFKGMMPTFAWEVLEVYSGPPVVSFKWRHWGVMKEDYVGYNKKGEKVTIKAHGEPIEVFGVTVAHVDDKRSEVALWRTLRPGAYNAVEVNAYGYIFALNSDSQFTAYEYREGTPPAMNPNDNIFVAKFGAYLQEHDLAELLGLQVLAGHGIKRRRSSNLSGSGPEGVVINRKDKGPV
ncbi:hypothetical protein DL771_009465 [Monosporascus sp. 5C6A]|nr:hypothetical protein DL771_009465 [Monosporascus sp. 5C6A]